MCRWNRRWHSRYISRILDESKLGWIKGSRMPSHETIYWVCWHIRRLFVQALSVLGSLSWLAAPLAAQELRQQLRSVSDVRPRIPDEHDRPYFREAQSHRGWEIREPQSTVFAATSVQDAREAAGHVSQAWNDAAGIARRWTDVPSNPDF